jgi:hypothetical protein
MSGPGVDRLDADDPARLRFAGMHVAGVLAVAVGLALAVAGEVGERRLRSRTGRALRPPA